MIPGPAQYSFSNNHAKLLKTEQAIKFPKTKKFMPLEKEKLMISNPGPGQYETDIKIHTISQRNSH